MVDHRFDYRIVTHHRVATHTMGPMGPTSPLSHNHWSIYLLINDGASSVRLNMEAPAGYITGELKTTSYDYALSNSAIKYWDYATTPSMTVSRFVSLLIQHGRQLYNMSGGGSGCRYWM